MVDYWIGTACARGRLSDRTLITPATATDIVQSDQSPVNYRRVIRARNGRER